MAFITSYFGKSVPKPSEVLTEEVCQSVPELTSIEASEVKKSLQQSESRKRGKYTKLDAVEKKEIGLYALKHGTARAVRDMQKKYPGLKKQSVHDFKKVCTCLYPKTPHVRQPPPIYISTWVIPLPLAIL